MSVKKDYSSKYILNVEKHPEIIQLYNTQRSVVWRGLTAVIALYPWHSWAPFKLLSYTLNFYIAVWLWYLGPILTTLYNIHFQE